MPDFSPAIWNKPAAAAAPSAYTVDNSLKFDGSSSSLLGSSSISTGTTWTVSFWVKRSSLGVAQGLLSSHIKFNADDTLIAPGITSTDAVFRDTSSWYHIFAAPTVGLFINGVQQAGTIDTTTALTWGTSDGVGKHGSAYLDGYLADFHVIDGTAKAVGDFAETDSNGQWVPKEYTGDDYGTNGFHLDFSDSADLGADAAGSNDFTATNLGSEDQMGDTPSAGNNYCTLNPIGPTTGTNALSEGNLKSLQTGSYNDGVASTFHLSKDTATVSKWYWEAYVTHSASREVFGIIDESDTFSYPGGAANGYGYTAIGSSSSKVNNGSFASYGDDLDNGNIVGVALDLENNKIFFSKDGVWQNSGDPANGTNPAYSITADKTYVPAFGNASSSNVGAVFNFGQDPTFNGNRSTAPATSEFAYTPPTDFKSLCTANLDDPGLNNAVTPAFAAKAYDDGHGAKTFGGAADMQPDLVWVKSRGSANDHKLTDSVRGATEAIESNTSDAEATESDGLTAFGTDGFTVGDNADYDDTTGTGMVAWAWKAGTDITDESYNTAAGFSIRKYEGNDDMSGNVQSISHSLGTAPEMMIVKNRDDGSTDWMVYHKDLDSDNGSFLKLNEANAENSSWSSDAPWSISSTGAPTDSVFYVTSDSSMAMAESTNDSGMNYIAYLFRSVEGYSKVGSYTGNSSTNGPFIYCGFRPAFILSKNSSNSAGYHWRLWDTSRDIYNLADETLSPSKTSETDGDIDILSNGFKHRTSAANLTDSDYIFYAVADNPFKYANAR